MKELPKELPLAIAYGATIFQKDPSLVLTDLLGHRETEAHQEFAKQMAEERMQELCDELKRRAFSEVGLYSHAVEARITSPSGSFSVDVTVIAGSNWGQPYVVRVGMNTKGSYSMLTSGREMSFESVLLFVDDFLAGFKAGLQSMF